LDAYAEDRVNGLRVPWDYRQWLRWYDVEGNWIPTDAEHWSRSVSSELAQQQRDLAQQQRDLVNSARTFS